MNLPKWAAWLGITIFSILGPLCVYLSIRQHGTGWAGASLRSVWNDPIYFYAAIDLCAIFSIISYWTYQDCKRSKRTFWFWPLLYFVFGTPAFLVFKLSQERADRRKSLFR